MKDPQDSSVDDSATIQKLAMRLWPCKTLEELDGAMSPESLDWALSGMPNEPSVVLVLYAMNRKRVLEQLDYLPAEGIIEWADLERAAVRLGSVSLTRMGFILRLVETAEGMGWTLNPLHPAIKTLKTLRGTNDFLYRIALIIFKQENIRISKFSYC